MASHLRRNPWLTLSVLCLAVFLVVMDNTIVNVALPVISMKMNASNSGLQWVVDSYSLPFAGLLLAGGEIGDRIGRLRTMNGGLVAFAVWSALAASSHSMTQLLIARLLLGATAAFIFPSTLSLVTVNFSDSRDQVKAYGIWGATAGVAIAVGPVVGGYLITHFWFGSVFLVNIPVAGAALALTWWFVPESRSPDHRSIDLVGLATGCLGITALVLGIIEGPTWGWGSARIVTIFAVAVALLSAFTWWELHQREPMLDVRLFRHGAFTTGASAVATSFFCLFGFIFLVTQYFQFVRGYSALSSGLHTLPFAIVTMVATPLAAMVSLRVGTRWVVSTGLLLIGSALLWAAVLDQNSPFWNPLVIIMALFGVGFSLIMAPSTSAVMGSMTPQQIGAGAAVNEMTRELGGTLGVAVVGSIFSLEFSRRITELFNSHGLSGDAVAARGSMQDAIRVVQHLALLAQPEAHQAMVASFLGGFRGGSLVAAIVAISVALAVFFWLPATTTVTSSDL